MTTAFSNSATSGLKIFTSEDHRIGDMYAGGVFVSE
jgi:hypothetical protein